MRNWIEQLVGKHHCLREKAGNAVVSDGKVQVKGKEEPASLINLVFSDKERKLWS